MTDKEEDKKPVTYLLRNIPHELNKKLGEKSKESGRSKRIIILDALTKYLED